MVSPQIFAPSKRLLDVKQVAVKVSRSTRWIWRAVASGQFPAPVSVGSRGARWIEAEIDAWIDGLRDRRDGRAA